MTVEKSLSKPTSLEKLEVFQKKVILALCPTTAWLFVWVFFNSIWIVLMAFLNPFSGAVLRAPPYPVKCLLVGYHPLSPNHVILKTFPLVTTLLIVPWITSQQHDTHVCAI